METTWYLYLAVAIFFIGLFGVLVRRNVFFYLMSIELMLNAANLVFVACARQRGDINGQVLAFFVMALAAAEACVGLAIVILFFRKRRSISLDSATEMHS
ncbi:MAG: NADH-quinone oxidoreductase subunit NuoK [Chitinivibrionales bacterium]|nr:NADH-quinone oxidoreductase subunit NuoK [Chitinivibrionales bacterium]